MNWFKICKKAREAWTDFRSPVRPISGSSAILLSLIVSASVGATVFVSQKTMVQFLSARSSSSEEWEKNLVAKYGLTLGGFLVSNNFILCREQGWEQNNTSKALCKWTDAEGSKKSAYFQLTKIPDTTAGADQRKKLIFTGTHKIKDTTHKYQISFELLNWKDSYVKSLIGDIPQFLCRRKKTLQLVDGWCKPKSSKTDSCQKSENNSTIIPNTFCDNISNYDYDHHIVVMTVKTPLTKGVSQVVRHAGVRRPMAHVKIVIEDPPVCSLFCATSNTAFNLPACRSNPNYASKEGFQQGLSRMRLKITNAGPGSIYALSLFREDTRLDDPQDPTSKSYFVTQDLLEREGKKVFFPGDTIIFEDVVNCEKAVVFMTKFVSSQNWQQAQANATRSINQHAQPFMRVQYGLANLADPQGICVKESLDDNDNQDIASRIVSGNNLCDNFSDKGKACGDQNQGICRFSYIEPQRILGDVPASFTAHSVVETQLIIRLVPPH